MDELQNPQRGPTMVLYGTMVLLSIVLVVAMFATANGSSLVLPQSLDLDINGDQRFFDVRLPQNYDPQAVSPLLLVLHGGSGSSSRMEFLSGWTEAATAKGYIVVYAEGVDGDWNDGRNIHSTRAARENVDDVKFLNELIDKMAGRYRIDREHVYLTGFDSGGMMALRFACQESARVGAVAVVDALLPQEAMEWCTHREPVPAMFIVQKDSPVTLFNGGELKLVNLKQGWVLGANESAALWAQNNGCTGGPEHSTGTGGLLERWDYEACPGKEVRLLAIDGSTFDFPGGKDIWTLRHINGKPSSFDTVSTMLEFFEAHRAKP